LIAALRAVATADLRTPGVLLALEGAMAGLTSVAGDAMERWAGAEPSAAARWRRDAPLLRVAGKARRTRFEQALAGVTTGR